MSIAVSVTIRPSKRLTMAVYGMSVMIIGGVLMTLFELLGNFSSETKLLMTVSGLLGVGIACNRFHAEQVGWGIDISGTGVIRLWPQAGGRSGDDDGQVVYQMLPGSSLWPQVMLLRLRSEAGQTVSVRILPDSVTVQEFRSLSVALRWIAARGAHDKTAMKAETL